MTPSSKSEPTEPASEIDLLEADLARWGQEHGLTTGDPVGHGEGVEQPRYHRTWRNPLARPINYLGGPELSRWD